MMKILKYSQSLKSYPLQSSKRLFLLRQDIISNQNVNLSYLNNRSNHLAIFCNVTYCDIFLKIHISATAKDSRHEDVEEDVVLPSIKPMDIEDHSESFRNTLFPHSTDIIISQLKSCYSLSELVKIVKQNIYSFSTDHYIQLLLVLWDSMRHVHKSHARKRHFLLENKGTHIESDSSVPASDISNLILEAMDYLSKNADCLTPEVLACTLLYSHRLGISLKHPSNQNILMRINNLLDDNHYFPLNALSRLTIALTDNEELWTKLMLVKVLPYVNSNIENCNNLEDFRALTITMISLIHFLTEDIMSRYEKLTDQFLTNGSITENERSVIIKTIMLINYFYYRPESRQLSYRLFNLIENNIHKFFTPHLLDLQKVVLLNVEPQCILRELARFKESYTEYVVRQPKISLSDYHLIILPAGDKGLDILKEGIENTNTLDNMLLVLPHITTAHMDICHMFWNKMTVLLKNYYSVERSVTLLQRVGYRYMQFSSFMKMYHHRPFESQMLSLITTELVEGTASHIPKLLALFSAFVLAFDHRHRGKTSLSGDIVPHVVNTMGQFDGVDCLLLSRGLRHGLPYQKNKEMKLYLQLEAALSDRTRQILNTDVTGSVGKFNVVFRTFINLKGTTDTELLDFFLTRLEQLNWNSLTSRSLKNLVYNLLITNSLVPSVIDHLIEYCVDNKQHISGETAGKLLYMCYFMGYTPNQFGSFLDLIDALVCRDWKMINGLNLLQIALALSYFNRLPKALLNSIFTVNFLERLDEEIKHCYAKDKYPLRVRRTLMELNRSVCLDHPEANVPWFHTKFCEEQQTLDRLDFKPKTLMYTDVLSSLTSIVGSSTFLNTKTYSHYGYSIDIQINLDDTLKPLNTKAQDKIAHRIAVLLHYGDSYTTYTHCLKGYNKMKKRHLEILGYKVLCIPDSEWNAMYMAEPKAKIEYLRNLIWPP